MGNHNGPSGLIANFIDLTVRTFNYNSKDGMRSGRMIVHIGFANFTNFIAFFNFRKNLIRTLYIDLRQAVNGNLTRTVIF